MSPITRTTTATTAIIPQVRQVLPFLAWGWFSAGCPGAGDPAAGYSSRFFGLFFVSGIFLFSFFAINFELDDCFYYTPKQKPSREEKIEMYLTFDIGHNIVT
jgi:hypothetical protein